MEKQYDTIVGSPCETILEEQYETIVEEQYETIVEEQYETIMERQYDTTGRLESYPWYAGMKSRVDAEQALHRLKDGTFLVRESSTRPGEYAIALK